MEFRGETALAGCFHKKGLLTRGSLQGLGVDRRQV